MLKAPTPTPVRLHPNLAGLYRQKIEALKAALDNEDIRTEALTIIRRLIEAVVVHPAGQSYEIELIGEIAGMVEIALGITDKKAAPGRAA